MMASGDSLTMMSWVLGGSLVLYVLGMFGLSIWAQRRINSLEDFLVAGRRLPLSIAWATLLATWFGAAVMLTATDEVRNDGFRKAALEPIGAGVALLLAGLFFAAPLWRMGLLTLVDFYRKRFGRHVETVAAVVMIPGYFGWIAAQFVALAGVLHMFFGIDPTLGILLVALVGMSYTLIGGMWSVALTDAVQMTLVFIGLGLLGYTVFDHLGDGSVLRGWSVLAERTPEQMMRPIPNESRGALVGWIGVLAVGALGNLPGQDLMQRVFAAKSAKVAGWACIIAGVLYIVIGMIPVLLGLAANQLLPAGVQGSVVTALASAFLRPWMAVIFTLAVASAVLSTIDSAILSPASVLAQNLLSRLPRNRLDPLKLNRLSIVFVTLASLACAYSGESAYGLLEVAYEIGLVALVVPLAIGVYTRPRSQVPALASMAVGTALWLFHYAVGWETFLEPWLGPIEMVLPTALMSAVVSIGAYVLADRAVALGSRARSQGAADSRCPCGLRDAAGTSSSSSGATGCLPSRATIEAPHGQLG